MAEPFIAELHDIGKLVDIDSISGHTFEDFDFSQLNISKPSSASWWGQYHHCVKITEDINNWPSDIKEYKADLFLLILADHLASSISRALILEV